MASFFNGATSLYNVLCTQDKTSWDYSSEKVSFLYKGDKELHLQLTQSNITNIIILMTIITNKPKLTSIVCNEPQYRGNVPTFRA